MSFTAWLAGKAIGATIGKVAGNAAKGVVDIGRTGVAGVAKAFEDPGDLKDARKHGSPSENGNGILRRMADAVNMMVRPTMAFFIMGAVGGDLMGYWDVDTTGIDPDLKDWFEWTMSFYFGQRAIVHDMPKLIKNMRGAFAKKKDNA